MEQDREEMHQCDLRSTDSLSPKVVPVQYRPTRLPYSLLRQGLDRIINITTMVRWLHLMEWKEHGDAKVPENVPTATQSAGKTEPVLKRVW
jgi:hypothetical protein